MSRFEITPEDVGRNVKFRNGNQGQIIDFQPHVSRPVLVLDEDCDRIRCKVDGSVLFDGESGWDIVAVYGPQTATEQPISFDSGYVQKKLGEYFTGLSLQQADSVRPKDLRDEFAMAALTGMCRFNYSLDFLAKKSYEVADMMMKVREEK